MRNILSFVFLGVLLFSLHSCSKQDSPSKKVTYADLPSAIKKIISDVDCEAVNRACGFTLTVFELRGEIVYLPGTDNNIDNGIICCGGLFYYDGNGVLHSFEVGKDGKEFNECATMIGEVWKCSDPKN